MDRPDPVHGLGLRDLVGHLVGMDLVFASMLAGGPMPDRGVDHLGDDPAAAYRRSSAALLAAATRPGVLEQTQETPLGAATGAVRLQWRVVDLLSHGWDLSQATDLEAGLPDDLAEQSPALAQERLPGQPRTGRFAEAQPVGDDVPAIDRLAALTGRRVPWTP